MIPGNFLKIFLFFPETVLIIALSPDKYKKVMEVF